MQRTHTARKFKIRWGSIAFFAVLHAAALGGAFYAVTRGLTAFDIALFWIYAAGSLLAIGVGYHRLYAHAAFKLHPAVQAVILFFGAATFQQSALKWASLHRSHHRWTDTDLDPYNIRQGFFYAHIGWILFWKHAVDYANVRDLEGNALVAHQHRHFRAWSLLAGLAVPVALSIVADRAIPALLVGVAARLVVVFHATFFINSFAHTFGSADYDARTSARDHWLAAVLTNGEGYHNFHHRFPSDYRNGIRWYHWDPNKWVIGLLAAAGLARDLNRAPRDRIEAARLEAAAERAAMAA